MDAGALKKMEQIFGKPSESDMKEEKKESRSRNPYNNFSSQYSAGLFRLGCQELDKGGVDAFHPEKKGGGGGCLLLLRLGTNWEKKVSF